MEIQILDNQNDVVYVRSAIGCFCATWYAEKPIVLKQYIVELDCDDLITMDAIKPSSHNFPYIETINGETFVTGLLQELQEDIMLLYVYDSIMMINFVFNIELLKYVGSYVSVKISEIKLFDTGII